jgi:hypothetical protein
VDDGTILDIWNLGNDGATLNNDGLVFGLGENPQVGHLWQNTDSHAAEL